MNIEEAEAFTVEQVAVKLQLSADTVLRWIREGHLRAFVRPGQKAGVGRGKKAYRIWKTDWDAFARRNSGVAVARETETANAVISSDSRGTDGVKRRKARTSGPAH